jgi:alpha-L-arabinofuranosidase
MIRSYLQIGVAAAIVSVVFSPSVRCFGQSGNQAIYSDSLQSGWQNWSWATVDLANTSPIHNGTDSIAVTAGPWQAIFIHHNVQDSYQFDSISFWINGGPVGGQKLQVVGLLSGVAQTGYPLPALPANTWQQVTIKLSDLGVAGKPNLDGFWIMDASGTTQPTFYLDDISLTAATTPPPTSANVSVNAASTIRSVDARLFGVNTAVWDFQINSDSTATLLRNIGATTLRFPGGSTSDAYDWSTDRTDGNTWTWTGDPGRFADIATKVDANAYVTVNYGSGTPQMAAAWVAWANASTTNTTPIGVDSTGRDWKTADYWASLRAASPLTVDDGLNFLRRGRAWPFGLAYWEIGNEVYGGWENDQHGVSGSGLSGVAHDPTTYATAFAQFAHAMRAVDPTIKLGAVAITGEDSYGTGLNPVPNPNENNKLHSGWTPVMLATLSGLGVTPDFMSYHRYPQTPWMEDDYVLLESPSGWKSDATDLRKMLTDYMGSKGSNVELAATETSTVNNSPGKQSVSLVSGLFYADSLGSVAETEVNANLWWNLRGGTDLNNNNSSTLYGWHGFGDFGMLASGDRSDTPLDTPYPAYYGAKLTHLWASAGDNVVSATSDYARLSVHAVRKQNGHLALLVVNKSPTADLTGHIDLTGFSTAGTATVYSYGKANDTGNTDVTQSTVAVNGTKFDYVFPSYSMTVIDLPYGHTLPVGLQMISAPYDYTGTQIGTLLGSGAKLYYWDAANFSYAVTPTAPADTLHLGAGYWVKMASSATVTTQGTPAPVGTPFKISLKQGWNMIGDPFTSPIAIGSLMVDTPTPSTPASIGTSTLVGLPLYAFNGAAYVAKTATDSIDPYSGYWIYATQPATLIVPAP